MKCVRFHPDVLPGTRHVPVIHTFETLSVNKLHSVLMIIFTLGCILACVTNLVAQLELDFKFTYDPVSIFSLLCSCFSMQELLNQ